MANFTNERKRPDITTYGPNFMNKEALVRLSFTYADNNLILNMIPLKDENDFNSLADKGIFLQMSATTASQIADELRDARNSFKMNEPFNETILCGMSSTNGVNITDGSNIGQPYGIYLVIYKNLDGSRKTDQFMVYPFKHTVTLHNLDIRTGKAEERVKPFREVKDVIHAFEDFARGNNKAQAHMTAGVVKKNSELSIFNGKMSADSSLTGRQGSRNNQVVNNAGFMDGDDYFGNSINVPFN